MARRRASEIDVLLVTESEALANGPNVESLVALDRPAAAAW
jgi:hypothetical protein